MTFQLTLKGYDGGTDETDHLIVWVKAASRAILDWWLIKTGLQLHLQEPPQRMGNHADKYGFEDGVDAILDDQGNVSYSPKARQPDRWIADSLAVLKQTAHR